MDEHFRAFSFVDRIQPGTSGMQIRGSYHIPEAVAEFSSSLVAEAVGQLAAWGAMVAVDFRARPVAGIASRVQMGGAPHHDGCPCCPDGTSSMKDCLAMCSLAAALTPSVLVVPVTPSHSAALVEFADHLTTLSDPPLKPPPIA